MQYQRIWLGICIIAPWGGGVFAPRARAHRALLFQRIYPQWAGFDTPPKMPPKER